VRWLERRKALHRAETLLRVPPSSSVDRTLHVVAEKIGTGVLALAARTPLTQRPASPCDRLSSISLRVTAAMQRADGEARCCNRREQHRTVAIVDIRRRGTQSPNSVAKGKLVISTTLSMLMLELVLRVRVLVASSSRSSYESACAGRHLLSIGLCQAPCRKPRGISKAAWRGSVRSPWLDGPTIHSRRRAVLCTRGQVLCRT
jgi:hypothetical protein